MWITSFNCFMCSFHVQHMFSTCSCTCWQDVVNLFIFSPKGDNVDVKTLAPAVSGGGGGVNSKRERE